VLSIVAGNLSAYSGLWVRTIYYMRIALLLAVVRKFSMYTVHNQSYRKIDEISQLTFVNCAQFISLIALTGLGVHIPLLCFIQKDAP